MVNVMKAADLHRVVHNSLLMAHKDSRSMLPMIEMIRLEFTENQVIGLATDRFVLGVTRADYEGVEMNIQLGRDAAENLLKQSKPSSKYHDRIVHIEVNEAGRASFGFSTGEGIALEQSTESFPQWRKLVPTDLTAPSAANVSFNPANLVKFSKVIDWDRRGASFNLTSQGTEKPALVTIGDNFIGLMMPVRSHVAGWSGLFKRPVWIDAPVEQPVEVPAEQVAVA